MTLHELAEALTAGGVPNAATEARLLFCHFSGLQPHRLIGADPDFDTPELRDALRRRLLREPLQYILGETAFYREIYTVTPATLIPRPDTELLVEAAICQLPRGIRFADLCTGSGCIAISILANRPDLTALAVDLSADALDVARLNASRNGVADRITFAEADVLRKLPFPPLSAVLCNPPYIPSRTVDTLAPELRAEPRAALDGGADGLLFYRSLLSRARELTAPGGLMLLEIGYDQEKAVLDMAQAYSLHASVTKDLGENPRLALIRV